MLTNNAWKYQVKAALCQVIMGWLSVFFFFFYSPWHLLLKLSPTSYYVGKKKDQSLRRCIYFNTHQQPYAALMTTSTGTIEWLHVPQYQQLSGITVLFNDPFRDISYLRNTWRDGFYLFTTACVIVCVCGYVLCSMGLCNVRSTS